MNKAELLRGKEFYFESDFSEMCCSYGRTLGGSLEFKIIFNAKCVHLSKTFPSFKRKAEELIRDHGLKVNEELHAIMDPEFDKKIKI